METILKELEKARPSKKILKQEFAKIQNQLTLVENNTDISEFDEEIFFVIVVRNKGEYSTWLETISNAHRYTEEELVKNSRQMIEDFNSSLKPLEKVRELVRVVKHIQYKQSVALWTYQAEIAE